MTKEKRKIDQEPRFTSLANSLNNKKIIMVEVTRVKSKTSPGILFRH